MQMQSIINLFKSISGSLIILTLISCTNAIPVSERVYKSGVIGEYEIGSYLAEKKTLVFDKKISPIPFKLLEQSTQRKLITITEYFKRSSIFLMEKSEIKRIVWDENYNNARFQLHNCKYFMIAIPNENSTEIFVTEHGIMAPCGR